MKKHELITIFIALVWSINGFACKLLNLVPRHQEIVTQILGSEHASLITKGIGLLEIALAIWILSGNKSKLVTGLQILLVLSMNSIEYIKTPELLLFGKLNLFFAILFILILILNEFYLKPKQNKTA